ncbi:MAG: glycosyltransferase family 39 protein [Anaerolineales bacterium]|jgi:hypothetical protein|nr:glycosyltransferase family 39 protein [Anaerolineales bacterium]GER81231.1 conserved hypothetical protein [Candidatus Denitrolinea symbiosum]
MTGLRRIRVSFPWAVFCAALVLRLIPVLLARDLGIGLDDMFQYDMLARSLASGNGFRWYAAPDLEALKPYVDFDLSSVDYDPVRGVETSFRAPLYPAFLALVYFLVGSSADRFFAARLAQAVLGAALAPLTYLVARKTLPEKERAAKLAAWIVAVYPILLAYPLGLGTENPFFLLLLASFLFLLKALEPASVPPPSASRLPPSASRLLPSASRFPPSDSRLLPPASRLPPSASRLLPSDYNLLLSGLFLGLTALTRSVILPFAILAIAYAFYVLRKRAWILAIAFMLTIAPWIVRNSLLHHKLTGIETSMGYNLYLGYHPQGNGSFVFGPSLDLLTILDDAQRDRVGTEKAIEFIRAEPGRFIPLAINRLGFFFGLEKRVLMYFYGNDLVGFIPFPFLLTLFLVMLLPFVVVSLSAALGASLLRWNPPTILLGLLFFAYVTPHVFILAEDRFHLALVPFLAILAALFWTGGWKSLAARWDGSRAGKIAVSLAVLAALLLLLNWGLELHRDADKIIQLLGPNGNHSNYPY